MNVITDPWLPVLRRNGTKEKITPFQITTQFENPIINTDLGRPDFNAAAIRFIIGLYNSYLAPPNKKKWKEQFEKPFNADKIYHFLKPEFFELDGNGPRFLQDKQPEILDKDLNVGILLFDTPGKKTVKDGKAFFQKPLLHTFCPTCAIIALYQKQYSAIMGGAGYRTSITSGANGSLNTFITGNTLWATVWSNVIPKDKMSKLGGKHKSPMLPWLSHTQNSSLKKTVSLDTVNPYYPLWEMPLRYYLLFEKFNVPCTICGEHHQSMVRRIKTKNYGNCYVQPRHIFSPLKKDNNNIIFRKPITFTNYTDLVTYLFAFEKTLPSHVVENFMGNRDYLKIDDFCLWAFGYCMDKAKLLGWEENLYVIHKSLYKDKEFTIKISELSNSIGWNINNLIRRMWNQKLNNQMIFHEFFQQTEADFYKVLEDKNIKNWIETMVIKSFNLFERHMGSDRIGLQFYMKERFIEILNKKIISTLEIEPLDFQDFTHIEYKKRNLPYLKKEFIVPFLSWYGTIKNTEKHRVFSRSYSLETLYHEDLFIDFIANMSKFYPALTEENMKETFAAVLLVVFKTKDLNFSQSFPAQMALNNIHSRQLDKIFRLQKNEIIMQWKLFADIITQLESFNIISFLNGFIHWNDSVKKYWKKEYTKNI